jgi:hypothetical protein
VRTGDDGFQNHLPNPWAPTDSLRWW